MEDLKVVANENLTLEMYVMQLIHLKDIGQIQEKKDETQTNEGAQIFKNYKNNNEEEDEKKITSSIKNQLKSTNQIKTNLIKNPKLKNQDSTKVEIENLQDLINIATKEKEIELKYDLERNVKLVSFKKGKIDISFNEKLNKKFIKILTEKLLAWTGERWIISLSKNSGAKTVYEKNLEDKSVNLLKEQKSELAKKIFSNFPDAKLIDVKEDKDA
jgi:DNA polymerase-3 subunit gamma/tau